MKRTLFSVLTLSAALFLGIACLNSDSSARSKAPEARADAAPPVPATIVDPGTVLAVSGAVADIAEAVTSSVVTIYSDRVIQTSSYGGPFSDPFFQHFFGQQPQQPQQRHQEGLGSGVVLTSDGYIVTNNHVVVEADSLLVKLTDGREFNATVVGSDAKSDLAVLKIDADRLLPITVGDSNALRVGEFVMAVGNPFGVGTTVTMGIVSATGRSSLHLNEYEDFIQTDAAINPGNSGGALVNMRGELVGINSAIYSRSGGYQGIGFAIPVSMAMDISDQIRDTGSVQRGRLGVYIQSLEPDLAEALELDRSHGVLITKVVPDSAASKAKLKANDVIVAVDDEEVLSDNQLRNLIASHRPDESVKISYLRNGKERTVNVVLSASEDAASDADNDASGDEVSLLSGVAVDSLDADDRRGLGLDPTDGGVVVVTVEPGSFADQAGLQRGDVILQVNKSTIKGRKEFAKAIETAENKVALLILRDGSRRWVVLRQR